MRRLEGTHQKLDITGAILGDDFDDARGLCGREQGNEAGWTSAQTLGPSRWRRACCWLRSSSRRRRISTPLMPLCAVQAAQSHDARTSSACLWAAGMFAWFFITTLYLQAVLGFTPFQIGLVFLPANLIMAAFSLGLSAKIVMKFGIRKPLALGLLLGAAGLAVMARAPLDANVLVDVVPSMVLLGIAAGIAFNPLLLAAMNDVKPTDSGLASGVVNTAFMMGGALGLAVLASLAAGRTQSLIASGVPSARGAERRVSRGVHRRRDFRRGIGGAGCSVDPGEYERESSQRRG